MEYWNIDFKRKLLSYKSVEVTVEMYFLWRAYDERDDGSDQTPHS